MAHAAFDRYYLSPVAARAAMMAVHRTLALALVGLAQDVAAAPHDAGPKNTAAPKPHLVYILSDNLYVSQTAARGRTKEPSALLSHRRISAGNQ